MKIFFLAGAFLASATAFAQIPTTGLMRQYTFSGNAADESGYAQDGTVYGASLTTDRFGNPNSAYYFDGNSDYIEIPNTNLLGLNTFSYSYWLRPASIPTNTGGKSVYSIGSSNQNQDQTAAYRPTQELFFGSYNTGNQSPFQSKVYSAPMAPNQWIHVVVIRDTASVRMYVNGSLAPSHQDSATHNQPAAYGTTSRAIIGARANLISVSHFHGDIDDLRHYDRALDPAEVQALYTESTVGNRITGVVFADGNNNGVQDSSELPIPQVIVQIDSAGVIKSNSSSNLSGFYSSYAREGAYTVTIPNPPLYHNFTPASHSATFTGLTEIDSLNHFGFAPIPNMNDLRVTLTSYTDPRPGFDSYYQINYKNIGTTTLSGVISFLPDSLYNMDSTSVTGAIISGDTISWSFSNLMPGQQQSIFAQLNLPATAVLGDTIHSSAWVSPITGDQTPADNTDTLAEIIIGSYDPNDKAVSPAGDITPQQVAAAQPLTYTIRFQNTGTAEAINVFIRDTLSNHLQIPSFEVLSASHPFTFSLKDNAMEFRFDNIMLPDSNSNEPASHGFIKYRIKPKTSLQLNDVIENTAYIFFDFNAPVVTNTTSTMVNLVSSSGQELTSNFGVNVYPNPGKGNFTLAITNANKGVVTTQVINALGQVVFTDRSLATNNTFEMNLNLHNLAGGIYFLQVNDGNQTTTSKLIIQK